MTALILAAAALFALVSPGKPGSTSSAAPPRADSQTPPLPSATAPPPPGTLLLPLPSAPRSPPPSVPSQTGPAPPPPRPVDLTNWRLTLPKAAGGGSDDAATVDAASSPPWLVRGPDGSLRFWAPVNGATTSKSDRPRTELISQNSFTVGTSRHTLSASMAITQATPAGNRDVVIGQLHGADNIKSIAFALMHYDGGTVRLAVKRTRHGSASDILPILTGVPIGARFDYTITDPGNGTIAATATYAGVTKQVVTPIPQTFRNAAVRFQAGAYQQDAVRGGDQDGIRLTYFTLREAPGGGP